MHKGATSPGNHAKALLGGEGEELPQLGGSVRFYDTSRPHTVDLFLRGFDTKACGGLELLHPPGWRSHGLPLSRPEAIGDPEQGEIEL